MGIKQGEKEVNTGDRKTSGRVGELKEVGLPARWAVFLGPEKGFPVKKVRPLPALDAQDEGLPVLKGRLKRKVRGGGSACGDEGSTEVPEDDPVVSLLQPESCS